MFQNSAMSLLLHFFHLSEKMKLNFFADHSTNTLLKMVSTLLRQEIEQIFVSSLAYIPDVAAPTSKNAMNKNKIVVERIFWKSMQRILAGEQYFWRSSRKLRYRACYRKEVLQTSLKYKNDVLLVARLVYLHSA